MGSNDKCDFCHTGEETVSLCGTLHRDKHEGKVIAAHHKCMQYSAMLVQYKSDEFGGFKKNEVIKEIKRGKRLACSLCKMGKNRKKCDNKGATSGCALASCRKTFHYYCVSMNSQTVAKRYKVSAGSKEVILYRVFCTKSHEEQYRDNISEDIAGQAQSSGEEDGDDEDKEDDSSKSGSDTEEEEWDTAGGKRTLAENTTEKHRRKKLRTTLGDDAVEQGTSSFSRMSSPDMTADEVVTETQRQYEKLLEKKRNKERDGKKGAADEIFIDTDSGENVIEDFDISNSPSADETDQSETESMLNSSQQGPLIVVPSKLEVADLKTICQHAELPAESVLLWPSSCRGLKDKHMPYVMWDIANRVRKGDPHSLVKLLSDSTAPDFETIRSFLSCGQTQQFDIVPELLKLVNDVNIKYNSEVIRLMKEPIDGIDLFILILSLPKDLLLEVDLISNFAVCQWTSNTVLTFSGDKIINYTLEKKLLLKWLSHRIGQSYELFVFPKEETLKLQTKDVSIAHSIASRLKSSSQKLFSDCPVKVMVVKNVDRKVTKFKPYINKLLELFVYQHPGFECYCVIDILPNDEIREICDVVPDSLSENTLQVYSAVSPTYNQVSCVVVHIDRDIRYAGKQNKHPNDHVALCRSHSKPTVYVDVDEHQTFSYNGCNEQQPFR